MLIGPAAAPASRDPAASQPHGEFGRLGRMLITAPRRWRYSGGKRDLRLDLLRGFSAFAMIVDHIGVERSWLYTITGGNRFIVSAAEAFVFISGVVMGMVYARVIVRSGIAEALMKALKRAWTLYLVTVGLTLSFIALSLFLKLPWAPDLTWRDVPNLVLSIVTLRRTFFLVDIPLMYALLLLFAGPVLLLLSQRHTLIVLAGSWGLWALWQLSPEQAEFPWHIAGNTVFNFAAWQVLFVTGIVIGFHRPAIEQWGARLSHPLVVAALWIVTGIVTALYVVQLFAIEVLGRTDFLAYQLFDKPNVPFGRILGSVLLFTFAFTATTVLWRPIRKLTGWLLLPLGEHALEAYSLHIFVIPLLYKFLPQSVGDPAVSSVLNAAVQIVVVMLVWAAIVIAPQHWSGFRRLSWRMSVAYRH